MAKKRLEKTLADYVVIAISPALIMTMVGSLVFFLLEVSYHGQFESRMRWIMFWFVFAAVLVSRIAIEEGREHARMFGLVMGGVTALAILRLVDAVIVGWVLLCVVWWCASKLTWDCTLIDDSEDASGEGLLQAAGFDKSSESAETPRRSTADPTKQGESQDKQSSDDPDTTESFNPKSAPHAPGLWVVYFSLAALPLFGIGQLFIPADEVLRRSYSFQLLSVYVASAISLLLTTSFLGLRRYLRQRKLEMPATMAGNWLAAGLALLLCLMLCALLIPRPQGAYTVTALIDAVDAKARQASHYAMLKGDRAGGKGRPIGDEDSQAKQPGESQPANQTPAQPSDKRQPGGNESGNAQQQSGDKKSGDQSNDQSNAGQQGQQGKKPQQGKTRGQSNQTSSITSRVTAQWAPFLKWILHGLLAIVVLYLLIRNWTSFVAVLAKLWAELLSLFVRKRVADDAPAEEELQPPGRPNRPFASFVNPFLTGAADRMSSGELVCYTFDALEAWSREQGVERAVDQTPIEFAQELGRRVPALANTAAQAADLYAFAAYAPKNARKGRVDILERLWRHLSS